MTDIVIASNNPGKLAEFQRLLAPLNWDVIPQSTLGIARVDETGLSFVENAIIKARHASELSQRPALADDSGLEVAALKGQPGIYSARYAGPSASDAENNSKLLGDLKGLDPEHRYARYQCVLVFMRHAQDPVPIICQGSWQGRILCQTQGEGGFGYDPIFFD